MWPIAVGIAVLVGAAHAVRPGHGKTLVAAYLVAERGRRLQAVALAVVIAALHTVSVLVLGLLWWWTAEGQAASIDSLADWGRLLVAVLVLGLGAVVCRRQWRAFRHRRAHGHAPHHHHHGPPEGAGPWSWSGLVAVASVGALVPSPAAFLLLVSGLLTGRAPLAVAMVVGFGLGLAATVLAVGLMVIAGRDWLGRRAAGHRALARLGAWAPLFGAAAIVCGGCVLSVTAVAALVGA
ncbi:hypothetical protein GCM10028833_42010 [Glycomyces tarimensis]